MTQDDTRDALRKLLTEWDGRPETKGRDVPVSLENLLGRLERWAAFECPKPAATGASQRATTLLMAPEYGKRYLRRDGKITAPITFADERRQIGFYDPASGWIYGRDGRAGKRPGQAHPADLIAVWQDPTAIDRR